MSSTFLYGLIVGCEVAFWLLLVLALAARYLLRRQRLSTWLLIAVPAVDIALLAFTVVDLKSGTPVTFAHGLAMAYIGFTIGFGSMAVRWADERFAHRFAAGPAPVAAPTRGWPAVRHEVTLWLRCVVACSITVALMSAAIAYVDTGSIAKGLSHWYRIAFFTVVLWGVFGPLWRLLFFGRRSRSGG